MKVELTKEWCMNMAKIEARAAELHEGCQMPMEQARELAASEASPDWYARGQDWGLADALTNGQSGDWVLDDIARAFAAGASAAERSGRCAEALPPEVAQARQTAEYWKAEHLAGNTRIGELHDEVDRLAKQRDDYRHGMTVQMEAVASMVDLLHRMLEAPTTQISVGWKDAIRRAMFAAVPDSKTPNAVVTGKPHAG